MKVSVEVTGAQEQHLADVAARLNVPVDALAAAALRDALAQPDDAFERAAARVLRKNDDLYKRLA